MPPIIPITPKAASLNAPSYNPPYHNQYTLLLGLVKQQGMSASIIISFIKCLFAISNVKHLKLDFMMIHPPN
jgi:hypothetical protein